MSTEERFRSQVAACLQARLSWPTADACADDLMQLFERQASATALYEEAMDLKTRLGDLTIDVGHFAQKVATLAVKS